MKLVLVANFSKPKVRPALDSLVPWLKSRCARVDVDTDKSLDLATHEADAILVLGGDGTFLSVARRLRGRQLPVMGVNYGRLGFLASFTPDELPAMFEQFEAGTLPISQRDQLDVAVIDHRAHCDPCDEGDVARHARFRATALNDCVMTAGAPFRMIELELGIDGATGIRYFGDGVIVATPSGSTAYNVSAGGPILWPSVEGLCITPLCPQSLSFRPVVVGLDSRIFATMKRVNRGTTLVCDGQDTCDLEAGDTVAIRRSEHVLMLVENPHARQIETLAEKLHWGATPKYDVPLGGINGNGDSIPLRTADTDAPAVPDPTPPTPR